MTRSRRGSGRRLLTRCTDWNPSGTTFAVPVRVTLVLPPSPIGAIALLLHESGGEFEVPVNASLSMTDTERTLSGDISHFSHIFADTAEAVTIKMTLDAAERPVGGVVTATVVVATTGSPDRFVPEDQGTEVDAPLSLQSGNDIELPPGFGTNGAAASASGTYSVRCASVGLGQFTYWIDFDNPAFQFMKALAGDRDPFLRPIEMGVHAYVRCTEVGGTFLLATGVYPTTGLTAPDAIELYRSPFAHLTSESPYAFFAGANGATVTDLSTKQAVLDRTAAGPDGATLGTNLLGATPVAQAASAGAPAAMIGFSNTGASVQNWNATNGWGASIVDAEPTFDVVTAGGGLVSNTVALVRPVRGIDFVRFDGTANAYRIDPARFAPYSAFVGTGNLVSAQIVDATSGDLLVLSRAAGPSISTSTKLFYKAAGDAQATTLLSMGNIDARRLRCIPVGTKQACVATMFSSGQGRAFLFDPATPRATPAVIVLTAAAGTLGVAQALLPNGHLAVAMANFTANSLTMAELSADLVTIHSLNTIPAPTGCTGTAHVALVTDSEGLKAITTCNGSNSYWIVRVP